MATRPALRALAERLGILSEFVDAGGAPRATSDETRVALLEAMGYRASSESAAKKTLRAIEAERTREPLPPAIVRASEPGEPVEALTVCMGPGTEPDGALEIVTESGERHTVEIDPIERPAPQGRAGAAAGRAGGRALRIRFPVPIPHGYHRLTGRLLSNGAAHEIDASLILAPTSCHRIREIQGDRRSFGIWTNLYTIRSRTNHGIGDLGDLRELVRWTRERGGAFVGINPLHATRNRGQDISPYSPISRLFRNPLYLEIGAIPELADCREARERMESADFRRELERMRSADRLEYDRVRSVLRPMFRALHRCFAERHRDRDTARGRAYAEFVERKGPALDGFATFMALLEHLDGDGRKGAARGERAVAGTDANPAAGPADWPAEYRDPRGAAVERFRRDHPDEIDLHRYLQFEMARQLATLEREAREGGMPIGIYADLAIGTSPAGSDPWIFPELFVDSVHIGAPPDAYSTTGQDWGLPPIDPRRLARDRFEYWIRLVRNALESAGALRIDHVMGLFRQYWVPAGRPATEGAYIRFPAEDLLGILALESRRHRALIIGEDLGTVPAEVPPMLALWGILSSSVMYFERDAEDDFRPASTYPPRALVTTTTHDHPPLRGYWQGRDLEIRRTTGGIDGRDELEKALEDRARERSALLRRLRAEGVLPGAAGSERRAARTKRPRASDSTTSKAAEEPDYPALCAAVHAFLARTPAPLLGISLDDLSGEIDPVNMPGTGMDAYPNWQRRMRRPLHEILADPTVHRTVERVSEARERTP